MPRRESLAGPIAALAVPRLWWGSDAVCAESVAEAEVTAPPPRLWCGGADVALAVEPVAEVEATALESDPTILNLYSAEDSASPLPLGEHRPPSAAVLEWQERRSEASAMSRSEADEGLRFIESPRPPHPNGEREHTAVAAIADAEPAVEPVALAEPAAPVSSRFTGHRANRTGATGPARRALRSAGAAQVDEHVREACVVQLAGC
jgi:hypothetical protein